tara:strand:- start:1861 stop:4533 length:2673 start_codon:yes stop_codon:yes gene_type:complete
MTNSHIKQSPFVGYAGFGGGSSALAFKSSAATKAYVDEVFSTYVYEGTGSSSTINNGIDLSGEGGLTWFKCRDMQYSHILFDTERGVGNTKALTSEGNNAEGVHSTLANITSFNDNGFTIGVPSSTDIINQSGKEFASWSFREKKGFFDIVTYTGTGSARTISHNLGVIPGAIFIKQTNATGDWYVYHRDMQSSNPAAKVMYLNTTNEAQTSSGAFNDTEPTSTEFSVGTLGDTNGDGDTFVAYLFAGGASTAATARSVDFDGSGDYLTVAGPGAVGTSTDFTMECWVYPDTTSGIQRIFTSNDVLTTGEYTQMRINAGEWEWNIGGSGGSWTATGGTVLANQWTHIALVRNGTNNAFYANGALIASNTNSHDVEITTLAIGGFELSGTPSEYLDGKVSNARFVNGTAVYTSSFRPPTEPLTSITNTSLLCCNDSSTTGKTTGGTITANGDPTASSHSPFDDTANFVFGADEDQNIIKTSSYTGNGSSDGPETFLGWEPQWVLLKNATEDSTNWRLYDTMRGIVTGGNDNGLLPDQNYVEVTTEDRLEVTSTGFKIVATGNNWNASGSNYIYIAIRRPDGYVGKLPSAGTDVFAMNAPTGSASTPEFISNFTVDYGIYKKPASTQSWYNSARLIKPNELKTDTTDAESAWANGISFDYNNGWGTSGQYTPVGDYQSWMWKRGQGFDVVCYTATGSLMTLNHSLNAVPEMYWIKNRDDTKPWIIYHKDLNGGTNPNEYYLQFDSDAEGTISPNAAAPTVNFFNIAASESWTNDTGDDYIVMLFASANDADGNPISKVGSYSGSGSQQTITTDFQPRFLILKNITAAADWYVLDTTRGWQESPASDYFLELNTTSAQAQANFGYPTATGFVLEGGNAVFSDSGNDYIYYAHA